MAEAGHTTRPRNTSETLSQDSVAMQADTRQPLEAMDQMHEDDTVFVYTTENGNVQTAKDLLDAAKQCEAFGRIVMQSMEAAQTLFKFATVKTTVAEVRNLEKEKENVPEHTTQAKKDDIRVEAKTTETQRAERSEDSVRIDLQLEATVTEVPRVNSPENTPVTELRLEDSPLTLRDDAELIQTLNVALTPLPQEKAFLVSDDKQQKDIFEEPESSTGTLPVVIEETSRVTQETYATISDTIAIAPIIKGIEVAITDPGPSSKVVMSDMIVAATEISLASPLVGTDETVHPEIVIQEISYSEVLDVYFELIAADTLNQQMIGPEIGEKVVLTQSEFEKRAPITSMDVQVASGESTEEPTFEALVMVQSDTEIFHSLASIIEQADDLPLEETLTQLAIFLSSKPAEQLNEERTTQKDSQASIIRETLKELGELLQPYVNSSDTLTLRLTPEITKKLLILLQAVGYKVPQEALVHLVSEHSIEYLLQAILYLSQLADEDNQQEFTFSKAPHLIQTSQDPLPIRIGRAIIAFVHPKLKLIEPLAA